MSFVSELKRRKVFQVAAVYLVVAWLIMQVVDVVNEPLRLPEWFATVAILIVAIGFPIALITSWAFDLTPEGVVQDQGTNVVVQSRGRRIEYILIGLLVVSVGWLTYRVEITTSEPAIDVVAEESQRDVLPNSIAVLLCDNLSPDPDNAYFAAGIHEEILNHLVKIRDLNVIARTSVLQYAGAARPITEIAQELNVGSIMECSVSYAEDRVAITAQLIDAETGVHLWSERYNRELADVFGIQADIATAIATALEAELLPSERESIEKPYTNSPAAYALYLRALDAGAFSYETSESYLNQAIELDPSFAVALATKANFLAQTFAARVNRTDGVSQAAELEATVHANAERALQLDPSLGIAHAALAELHLDYWREDEARSAYELAAELSPNDPVVLSNYAWFSSATGHYQEAIAIAQRVVDLNPGPGELERLGETYMFLGDLDTAAAIAQQVVNMSPADPTGYFHLAERQALRGNSDSALETLQIWEELGFSGGPGERARAAQLYSQLGRQEDAERVFALQQEMSGSDVQNALAFLAIEDYDESLRLLRAAAESEYPEPGDTLTILVKTNIWNDPILDQPEFVAVRSRLGFRE